MATPDYDYSDDVPDAAALQANITAADQTAITNARGFAERNAALQQAGGNLIGQGFANVTGQNVGDPRVVQARKIQTAMAAILQNANQDADPNEDQLDRQERIANAVAAGMANISPQIALKAAQQGVAVQQAKTQQGLLKAQTEQVAAKTAEDKVALDLKKASAVYQVHGQTVGKDGLPELTPYGEPVSMYNPDGTQNPQFLTQLQKNVADAKAAGAQNPSWSSVDKFQDSKLAVQMARGQAAIALEQQKAKDKADLAAASANLPEDTLRYYAGQSALLGPAALSRQPADVRNAVAAYKAAHGLQPGDEVQAQAEIVGLKSGERAIGTRAGNTAILQSELSGLAQNVQDTLAKVDRTKIPMVNAAIRAGAVQGLGSGPEAAYAAALQAFTTAHGRLIAGAQGGVTSDAARDQAASLVTGTQSPEAVKASLNQIVAGETPVIRQASDNAIGMMANRNKYPGITKISEKLGYSLDSLAPSPTVNSQPAGPGGAQLTGNSASKPSTGWGPAMKIQP